MHINYYVYVSFFKNRSAKHVFTAIEYICYAYISFFKKQWTARRIILLRFSIHIMFMSRSLKTEVLRMYSLRFVTFATHGPSAVPFQDTTWIQLHNYLKFVRPQVKPKAPYKHLVFLNANGEMVNQLGKAVMKVTKSHEKHITSTKVRHHVATDSNDALNNAERRAVAKGIRHSMEVHNKTYTDTTIKNIKALTKVQKKLHDKSKINTL